MFFSSPSADLKIMMIFLIIALIISIFTYVFSRKILMSVFLFSILSNIVLFIGIDYNLAKIYRIIPIFEFTYKIWPYINLLLMFILVFNFIKNRNVNRKN